MNDKVTMAQALTLMDRNPWVRFTNMGNFTFKLETLDYQGYMSEGTAAQALQVFKYYFKYQNVGNNTLEFTHV